MQKAGNRSLHWPSLPPKNPKQSPIKTEGSDILHPITPKDKPQQHHQKQPAGGVKPAVMRDLHLVQETLQIQSLDELAKSCHTAEASEIPRRKIHNCLGKLLY